MRWNFGAPEALVSTYVSKHKETATARKHSDARRTKTSGEFKCKIHVFRVSGLDMC